jgi:hypothetical protein
MEPDEYAEYVKRIVAEMKPPTPRQIAKLSRLMEPDTEPGHEVRSA